MTDLQATATGLPSYPEPQKLDVVEATRATWRVFRRQPWPFIGLLFIPILVTLPVQIVQAIVRIAMRGVAGNQSGLTIGVGLVLVLIVFVVQYGAQFTAQMAALWGAARNLEGGRFAFGDALRAGFSRLLPYVGLALLALLILLVGFILLVIPCIIAAGFLALAPAACVIERRGPIESIKRSFALVTGNWWRCFAAVMLTIFLPTLAFAATVLLVYLVCDAIGIPWLTLVMILPAIPFFILIGAIASIVPAVLFVELRRLKEGGAPGGGVARVFE